TSFGTSANAHKAASPATIILTAFIVRLDLSPLQRNPPGRKSNGRDKEKHDRTDSQPERRKNRCHPNDSKPSTKEEKREQSFRQRKHITKQGHIAKISAPNLNRNLYEAS